MHLPTTTTHKFGARTRIAKHIIVNVMLSCERKKSLALAGRPSLLETKRSIRGKRAMKVTSCATPRAERRRLA